MMFVYGANLREQQIWQMDAKVQFEEEHVARLCNLKLE